MNTYNLENILSLSKEPVNEDDFNTWVQQEDVVPFLEQEIEDENIIIYAVLPYTFIHAVLIPNINLDKSIVEDLLRWNHNPYSSWGMVVSSDDAWIEGPLAGSGSKTLSEGEQIIFARSFEGDESRRHYYELEQKISHVLELHHVMERGAWCRLDQLGDFEDIVKIIELSDLPNNQSGTLIT